MPRTPAATPTNAQLTIERVERMLAIAEFVGVDVDAAWVHSRKLQMHEAAYDRAIASAEREELARLMAADVNELAGAYKVVARAVERGGEA